ncbi:hypothetical protein AX17_005025 [Amanita inopinata Kibby_2008]|nr:hypothetical protein AX17_005025 [Amanita inopinata Kibby_2008]
MDPRSSRRKYSDDEKQQLLANLDLEVAHRTRQFEAWLADRLENFNIHQQGQISRIPKQVRSMKMREFGGKYNGNVQDALRGVQRDRMAAAGLDGNFAEINKSERKRKWVASQEVEGEPTSSSPRKDVAELRAAKNARRMPSASPKKKPGAPLGSGNLHRSRLLTANKPVATPRSMGRVQPSPSPQKSRPPFLTRASGRPTSRPASPTKHPASRHPISRVPSSSTFNPALPPKTPSFPHNSRGGGPPVASMRLPRKDESMLSVNGSPLANPYQFGSGWFGGMEIGDNATDLAENVNANTDDMVGVNTADEKRTIKRTKSSIIIKRGPSILTNGSSGLYMRPEPQLGQHNQPDVESEAASIAHSREHSQPIPPHSLRPPSYSSQFPQPPHAQTFLDAYATPKSIPTHTRSLSALVAIPTKDGHLLEFDPLQTSPGALEALEGISDSAKKQARLEMGRLVQAAVEKWKIS